MLTALAALRQGERDAVVCDRQANRQLLKHGRGDAWESLLARYLGER